MPDKYSFAKCEQYGRRLAARLCQQYFATQPAATLDGPALLQFTSLRQVNLLVLHQLLGRWQHEAQALRSPYFDFEAEAVRTALAQFMNVLSRHIAVGRAALEPLLASAIAHTLLLATDPAAAFQHLLLPAAAEGAPEAEVPVAYLRERLRYFEGSKTFLTGFVDSLPAGNAPLSAEFMRQRFELYLPAHRKELPVLTPLVAELSALLPLTEADLWDDGPGKAAAPKPAPVVAPRPQPVSEAPAASAPAAAPAAPMAPAATPVAPPASVVAPASAAPPVPVAVPAARPVVPSFIATEDTPVAPLHEKLKANQPAGTHLADTLRGTAGAGATLAERAAPKVGSLRAAISINQRYGFINELFNGENMEYHAAIEHLDQLPTLAEAMAYMQLDLTPRYDWGRKEEHVGKLLKLLERKFAEA